MKTNTSTLRSFLAAALIAAASFVQKANAQIPDSLKAYVWECIDTMQNTSLYAKNVDWKAVRAKAKKDLDVAKNITDAENIVIDVFSQLKDHHGMYGGIDTSYKYKSLSAERSFSPAILEEYKKPRDVKTRMLHGNIAYYKMPAVIVGSDTAKMRYWANRLTDSFCKLEQQSPSAYIIDLRMNNGGNIEPMWQALKGLIGEENKTIMVDASGKIVPDDMDSASLLYRASAIPDRVCKFRKNIKVAVLVGPGTASSGEIIAASFTTRKQTRLFGERTIGVANVTQGHIIQQKGYLLLTVAYIANKNKKPLKEGFIQPDEMVKSDGDNFAHPENDPTVLAALKWLTR